MGEKEQGTAEDAAARGAYMKYPSVEGERWKGAGLEQEAGEDASSRAGGYIKMGSVEGERWKGAGLENPAGLAVSDPGAPGDKSKT